MSVHEEVDLAIRLVDQVSATARQMEESADSAKQSVDALEQSVDNANSSISTAKTGLDTVVVQSESAKQAVREDTVAMERDIMAVQTKQALELSTLMAVKESVSAVTGGMIALGMVSDETAQDLMKVNAGFQLISGAATGLKALQVLMTGLNAQTAINASLNTFLSVVRNHALGMAAVGLGLGAMAGVAGMYLYSNNQSSKTVNIEVTGGTEAQRDTASQIYSIVNGGPL
jgi:hypothetical protein